jgi:single-strand DNA-binding protein
MFRTEITINHQNMAMSLNRVQLIGNLTRDPEMKQIPGGQVVTSFGVATNFTWKDQSGAKQSKAEFHNIVAWRKLAEICGQYLKKGSKIFIEGRLQTRDWEGEDGVKRYRTEVIADNMIMLDRKGDAISGMGMDREASGIGKSSDDEGFSAGGASPVAEGVSNEDVKIDDLPF